jgi:hypothetical protein
MTESQARAWRARWKLVNAAEIAELRATKPAEKLRQLAALMASVRQMGWDEALIKGDDEVRDRWRRLREKLCPGWTTR